MNLVDTFKIYATLTDVVSNKTCKVDITKITTLFNNQHDDCAKDANCLLRYINSHGASTEISIKETPETVVKEIQQQQLDLLGDAFLLKSFIEVTKPSGIKAYIALDALGRYETLCSSAKKKRPEENSFLSYAISSQESKTLFVAQTITDIDEQILQAQQAKSAHIKRQFSRIY